MNIIAKELKNTKKEDLHDFYYTLAHIVLRNFVLDTPIETKLLSPGKLVKWLWIKAFLVSGMNILPTSKGFRCISASSRDFQFLIFKFPSVESMEATHPLMSACVRRKGEKCVRYFILENTFDSTPEKPLAMLCEWGMCGEGLWHSSKESFDGDLSEKDFMTAVIKAINDDMGVKSTVKKQ